MSSCMVTYGRESIPFTVLFSARKTLAIAVLPDSRVVVKAPLGAELEDIRQRVGKRSRWILRQLQYFQQFDPRMTQRNFVGGETHLYLGRQFRLKFIEGELETVRLSGGFFWIQMAGSPDSEKAKMLLNRWYAEKADGMFQVSFDRCWPRFEKLGLMKPRMQTRYLKKRWGSLSRGGLLSLNVDLIRAPRECIDYVVTHELCHLKYHDHSSEFYRLLERMMPDWERRKHKLEMALA
ncbi:YgjP-like metallopeptidase domain-containing protein [Geobacter benzoatilyticus]|uniref:M48 family metallopeptidase n=1 Tax=Geobacter benzoatilyticus TaxID=2815309 RepID=A0ABX7Q6T8_9BACT|nr:M48 family metallopeptidase [Geobacter benzoatilyticus]